MRRSIFAAALAIAVAIPCAAVTTFAASELPPCDPNLPQPPLVVVLPDGSEVPATRIEYDLASRRVVVVGNPRLFCDGFGSKGETYADS